jgi:protein TonB
MRIYLIFSSSVHFLLIAVFFFLARNSFQMKKQQAYYIDFIGAAKVVTMENAGREAGSRVETPAAAKKTKAARPPAEDPFISSGESEPLPKPSVLGGAARLIEPAQGDKPGAGGSPVLADFSNFPYPWYITQVREALWNSWTERMPSSGRLKCTVKFDIQRSGAAGAVAVESSSGNRLFDYAAETTVENAAPFPPLPDDFYEESLTVHVEFKTTE